MARTRGAAEQRTDTRRRRGAHIDDGNGSNARAERRTDTHLLPEQTTDSFQLFLNQASRYPLLTAEQEIDLAKRIERGDLEAKELLINSNLRLVVRFATRYQGHGLSLNDLVQEAMIGLIRAAEKFDWRRGYKFSTYAVLWIKQSMQRGLDNSGRAVRIPAHIAQRERTVNRVANELSTELNREPTEEEIAERAKLPIEDVMAVQDLARVTSSLDAPVGDSETTLGELRAQSDGRSDDEVIDREREEAVSSALATLPEGERRVLEVRFGTGGEVAGTLRDAARAAGVTQEQARRLEAQGLKRLASDESLAGWREAA